MKSIKDVKEDILKNTDTFIELFPQLKDKILKLKRSPNCSVCIKEAVFPLVNRPALKEKLNVFYGKDIEIIRENPQSPTMEYLVFELDSNEYADFFKNLQKIIETPQQLKLYNTFFDPIKNKIIVSIQKITKKINQ